MEVTAGRSSWELRAPPELSLAIPSRWASGQLAREKQDPGGRTSALTPGRKMKERNVCLGRGPGARPGGGGWVLGTSGTMPRWGARRKGRPLWVRGRVGRQVKPMMHSVAAGPALDRRGAGRDSGGLGGPPRSVGLFQEA